MNKERISKLLSELTALAERALVVNSKIAMTKEMFTSCARTGNHTQADQERGKLHALLDESLDITERSVQLQNEFVGLQS